MLSSTVANIPTGVWIGLGAVAMLMVIVIVIALTTFAARSPTLPTSTPSATRVPPGQSINVVPATAAPGQLVTVKGTGFTPNDQVTVYLRDPARPSDPILQVARGVIFSDGALVVQFSYPVDPRWDLPRMEVIAQSAASGGYVTTALSVQTPSGSPAPTSIGIGTRLPMNTLTPVPSNLPPSLTPTPTATPTTTPTPSITPTSPPTNTPLPPTVTPTPIITDWRAEYYGNTDLQGAPLVVRNDTELNFNWGRSAPDPRVPADYFSVRWTRTLNFEGRLYRFSIQADDGVRVFVDNNLIINEWHPATPLIYTADVNLVAGPHAIRVEFYEGVFDAYVFFKFEPVTSFSGWKGEYFDNPFLGISPKVTRDDVAVAFDWGTNPPAPGLPNTNYSVRWTKTVNVNAGVYRFMFRADDGVRFLIDGNVIINEWHEAGSTVYTRDVNIGLGAHTFQVEYLQYSGNASIWFTYQLAGDITKWKGEYFANDHLAGYPTLLRDDDRLDFDWGTGSPDPLIPADRFSVRWTRAIDLAAGQYQFDIIVDDGVRFYVDGLLVIDQIREQGVTKYSAQLLLPQGAHTFRIDYVEYGGQARLAWSRTPLSATPTPANTPTPNVPSIVTFTVTPNSIQQGGCVNVTWAVNAANSARILRNGNVWQNNIASTGAQQDCLGTAGSYVYRIEAFNAIGQVAFQEQLVIVQAPQPTATQPPPAPPTIDLFTAAPNQIQLTQCVTLTWSTSRATTPIALLVNNQQYQNNLLPAGNAQHCPTATGTLTYTLMITSGPNNGPVTADAIVNVTQ